MEDNERLQAMVASGVSVLRAAAAFECSMDAARKLGTPFPSVRDARKSAWHSRPGWLEI